MKVLAEIYKGIEFVRISKLPEEQKVQIKLTLPASQIIKILKETELLTDCVQFKHYEVWYDQNYRKEPSSNRVDKSADSKTLKVGHN